MRSQTKETLKTKEIRRFTAPHFAQWLISHFNQRLAFNTGDPFWQGEPELAPLEITIASSLFLFKCTSSTVT